MMEGLEELKQTFSFDPQSGLSIQSLPRYSGVFNAKTKTKVSPNVNLCESLVNHDILVIIHRPSGK